MLAAAIHGLEEGKHGACFRFCTAFNCQPGIPFFPVASAPAQESPCWAIGTENSGLLHAAFKEAAEAAASGGNVLDCAQDSLRLVMASALEPVEALAQQLAAATGHTYLGIDASIAPALEPPSIGDAYELLGLGRFGLSGTLAISGERSGRACWVRSMQCGWLLGRNGRLAAAPCCVGECELAPVLIPAACRLPLAN